MYKTKYRLTLSANGPVHALPSYPAHNNLLVITTTYFKLIIFWIALENNFLKSSDVVVTEACWSIKQFSCFVTWCTWCFFFLSLNKLYVVPQLGMQNKFGFENRAFSRCRFCWEWGTSLCEINNGMAEYSTFLIRGKENIFGSKNNGSPYNLSMYQDSRDPSKSLMLVLICSFVF